ncbi:MAG TPA: DUF6010 family protein [Myxococcota bacterium]|nr:DUF6010 family protein [Myxococcota bacterium]
MFIGLAWLMHTSWDLVHHLYGNVIWPFMPTSSFGRMIFDVLIAIWFFAQQIFIVVGHFFCTSTRRPGVLRHYASGAACSCRSHVDLPSSRGERRFWSEQHSA